MATCFTAEAMKFLRGLARNNDREWFEARRNVYERALKAPMLALVDEINGAMEEFAPEHVRPPHKITMRIYRDIRFSANKLPYKTHLAAWWSRRGMEKTSGGGFYLQVSPKEVIVAAGVYMPEREQLLTIRRWMSENHEAYRASVKKLMRAKGAGGNGSGAFQMIDSQALTRMPRGFATDDPADELVRAKNWGARVSLPAGLALEPVLAWEIARLFRMAAPLVETLNGVILKSGDASTKDNSGLN